MLACLEQGLHSTAEQIYHVWIALINTVFTAQYTQWFSKKCLDYQHQIKEKVGESVVRFKGSRDVDLYGAEEQMRVKLAHQLRNQDKYLFRDLAPQHHLVDQTFFSPERPIFFEERAGEEHTVRPNEVLVIMVHGLGACFLDMEKLKVELRRYYDSKVRIYISRGNEARTEGDIEEMGNRLAAEVTEELTKY